MDEIDRLRAGGSKADVEPEVKTVVERLTGIPYERCWRE
ncbi:oligogalacturonide transporter [Bifidobacterium catulorum]|uniref:Oligogalacturonide transporter n=1 Tax=Bifidobacterium catulorum TaxID=1630173 RepID=A0A2U2MTY7_9BIFI|nr:oligogalacturonide transporter [Bifidobacterium catulorum]